MLPPVASSMRRSVPIYPIMPNWSGELPDYTQPAVLTAMQNQHRRDHLSIGVSGYKIDECDASLPSHAHFPSGLDGVQMNQILGMLLTKNQDALFREKNTRTYSMVRAGNLGGCGYPFAFYSDRTDLREYVRMLCNSGFSGLLWSPEVCGASSGEEWVRRMPSLAFSLHTQLNAWASGVKPWDFEDVAPIVRNLLALHMRLVPYLYNTLADFHFAGKPPIRAMALEFSERSCASLDDQYMLGDALLVAPLFPGESSRRVYLPEGGWYALDTHEYYAGGQWHDLYLPISRLPVLFAPAPFCHSCPRTTMSQQLGFPSHWNLSVSAQRIRASSCTTTTGRPLATRQGSTAIYILRQHVSMAA